MLNFTHSGSNDMDVSDSYLRIVGRLGLIAPGFGQNGDDVIFLHLFKGFERSGRDFLVEGQMAWQPGGHDPAVRARTGRPQARQLRPSPHRSRDCTNTDHDNGEPLVATDAC